MSRTVLVAGGAGFIGSNFLRYAVRAHPDWSISVLDNFSFSREVNLKEVRDQVTLIRGDVSKISDVRKAIKNQEIVVNFAAQTHVDRSIVDSRPFVLTEVVGVDNLINAARLEGVERFLQVSTDEVYGEIKEGSFKTTDPLNPRNPYSAAKAGADLLVRASWFTFGTPVLVTRCSNNYGPFQHTEKFIPKIITSAIRNQKIPVYGSGGQVRDWIYVTDHCSAIDTVLLKGDPGQVYHVASGIERRNIELARDILKEMGKDPRLLKHVKDRMGHDQRYSLDTSATRFLGWKPQVGIVEGLRKTIEWYRSNEKWWRALS